MYNSTRDQKTTKEHEVVIEKLDSIMKMLENLHHRVNQLENKTDDMHRYIPFVEWLRNVGQNLSERFRMIGGFRQVPDMIKDKE
jgi:uncharacterized membrane protein